MQNYSIYEVGFLSMSNAKGFCDLPTMFPFICYSCYMYNILQVQSHKLNVHCTQEYYPNFLESGFYLRFLDDLLRMVKLTPDQQTLAESNSLHTTTSCQTEVKTVDYFTCDVDDPESLWKQPQLL